MSVGYKDYSGQTSGELDFAYQRYETVHVFEGGWNSWYDYTPDKHCFIESIFVQINAISSDSNLIVEITNQGVILCNWEPFSIGYVNYSKEFNYNIIQTEIDLRGKIFSIFSNINNSFTKKCQIKVEYCDMNVGSDIKCYVKYRELS